MRSVQAPTFATRCTAETSTGCLRSRHPRPEERASPMNAALQPLSGSAYGLVDRPRLRGDGTVLDHRGVPAGGGRADIERAGFTGFPIGSGMGLVEGVIELGMVRHEGGRGDIGGSETHPPIR